MDSNDYRLLRNTIDQVGEVQTHLGILIKFICEVVEKEELDIHGYSILTDTHGVLVEITEQVRDNRQLLMEVAKSKVKENCNLTLLESDGRASNGGCVE
jgi:hypothetical protein